MHKLIVLLCFILLLAACESEPPKQAFTDLPTVTNAFNGETIFNNGANGTPACSTCHQVNNSQGNLAPSLQGYGEIAGQRVDGESAAEYSFYSIVQPSKYVVTGYSNVMYTGYDKLTAQQLADLIAYLLEL